MVEGVVEGRGRGWGVGGDGKGEGNGEGFGQGMGEGEGEVVGVGKDIVKIYNFKVGLYLLSKGQGHPARCSLSGPKLRECEGRLLADSSILKITNDCILRFFDFQSECL